MTCVYAWRVVLRSDARRNGRKTQGFSQRLRRRVKSGHWRQMQVGWAGFSVIQVVLLRPYIGHWYKLSSSPPICHIQYKQNDRISEKLLHPHFSVNMIYKSHLTYCSTALIECNYLGACFLHYWTTHCTLASEVNKHRQVNKQKTGQFTLK